MIEYNNTTSTAIVYHLGNHKCGLQVDTQKRNSLIKKSNTRQEVSRVGKGS